MIRLPVLCAAIVLCSSAWSADGGPGATRVAKWKDDKQAAFILMFDDSCQTHVKLVIPELVKRRMAGTFYLNPGSGQHQALKNDWEVLIPKLGMEYANHTFTHKGATSVVNLEDELLKCNEAIDRIAVANGGKAPGLISFGRPGVDKGKWTVTDQELKDALAKHRLVMRPNIDGRFAKIHLATAEAMFAIVEKTIASGGVDCLAFHGVGGDWLEIPMAMFTDLLDRMTAVQDKVWVGGHIATLSYQMERDGAKVAVEPAGSKSIRLKLTTSADPALYGVPLTLVTHVPTGWTRCKVSQGAATVTVAVSDGAVRYDALPDGQPVVIQPTP
jgi:hypothetical protein